MLSLHGFGQSQREGRIDIRATTRNKLLILEVEDNGIGIRKAQENQSARKRKSIGVQNLRESLELMFKTSLQDLSWNRQMKARWS